MKALKSPLAAALLRAGVPIGGPFRWNGKHYAPVAVPKAS